jgi:hypothetical protein
MPDPGAEADREFALKIARILAVAGCDRITNARIEKLLLSSTFFKNYSERLETDAKKIHFDLCTFAADNEEIPSSSFFPLPFEKRKDYLVAFFRPHFFSDNGCKIDIIQLCKPPFHNEAIGYRIERGHRGSSDPHGYLHVQMTPSFPHSDGPIQVHLPPGLSSSYPAYPIPHRQVYASLYGALVAFAGLRRDWQGGLIDEFEKCRNSYSGSDFDDLLQRLKDVCEHLY